jgi:hypothetical protein
VRLGRAVLLDYVVRRLPPHSCLLLRVRVCTSCTCSVALPEGRARGYVLEIFASHFQLPDLGPIGECVEQLVKSDGHLNAGA